MEIENEVTGPLYKSEFQISEFPEGFDPNQEQTVLTLDQKIKSKAWKLKLEALEELIQNQNLDQIEQYLNDSLRLVVDNNIQVQEKNYLLIKYYLKNSSDIKLDCEEFMKKSIEKVQKNHRQHLDDIIVNIFERQDKKIVVNSIIWGLEHKIPKIVALSLQLLQNLMNNYGISLFKNMQDFQPYLLKLQTHSNKEISSELIKTYKQIFLWMGEGVKGYLTKMSKLVIEDFEQFFLKEHETKVALREQFLIENNVKQTKPVKVDSYDIAQPVEILQSYNESWCDSILQEEKWKIKQQSMNEFIIKLQATVKIAPKNIIYMHSFLKKILNDSNINIQICGLKIVQFMTKGLRKNFSQCCKVVFTLILHKLKDKNRLLTDIVFSCLENIFQYVLNMDDLVEQFQDGLSDKTPQMKINVMTLIMKHLQNSKKHQIFLKNLIQQIRKLFDNGVSEVRDQSIKFGCKIYELFGEQFLKEVTGELQGQQKQKLQDLTSKIQPLQNNNNSQIINNTQANNTQNVANNTLQKCGSNRKINPQINVSLNADNAEQFMNQNDILFDFLQQYDQSKNWLNKVQLLQRIDLSVFDKKYIQAFLLVMQVRFKNWKDSNINLIKEIFRFNKLIKELQMILMIKNYQIKIVFLQYQAYWNLNQEILFSILKLKISQLKQCHIFHLNLQCYKF